jgi:flagellar hook protein FlgE
MGIGSAYSTALGGLNAFSTQISYISEDLANTSTVGYKGIGADFQSYVTGSTGATAGAGGVTVQPSYQNDLSGSITTTSTATNFAISGNGYIPVEVPSTTSSGSADFSGSTEEYTRAGDFTVNANGYLVNSAGEYLMGEKETTTFSSPAGSTIPSSASVDSLTPVQVSNAYRSMPGSASSVIDYNANFPASTTASSTAGTTSAQVTSQIQFYDSLGTAQTLQVVYQKTADNTWTVESATLPDDSNASVSFTSGTAITFSSTGTLSSISNPSSKVTSGDLGIDFTVSGLSDGATASSSQTVTLDLGTTSSGSSQYSGTSLDVRSTTDTTGKAAGDFESASINSDGYVVFTYTNGETAKPYRVPLVTFADADQLTRVSGATFTASSTSGSAIAQWAGEGEAGTITSSATEASNVDVATELTAMIVAQRAYSANAKVITAADSMLQDALALIH